MASFSEQIDNFGINLGRKQKQFNIEFMQDLAQRLIQETPVQTGYLRQSWAYGVNVAPPIRADKRNPEASYTSQQPMNLPALLAAGVNDTYYISNTANYAFWVEFKPNRKGSHGFTRTVIANARNIAINAANRVRASG